MGDVVTTFPDGTSDLTPPPPPPPPKPFPLPMCRVQVITVASLKSLSLCAV